MAVAFDKIVGTASNTGGSVQTLAITVAAGGVAIGDIVIVSAAFTDSSRVFTSVADSRGNTYRVDYATGPGNLNVRGGIAVAYISTALLAADTITVTWSGAGGVGPGIAIRADAFSGYTALPVIDQKQTANQTATTTPNTGTTGTTTNANDLLFVAFASRLEGTGTVPGDATFTNIGSSNAGASQNSITTQYKLVSAPGAYIATSAAATAATDWVSHIIAYQQPGFAAETAFTVPAQPGARRPTFLQPGSRTRQDSIIGEPSQQRAHPNFDNNASTWTRGGTDQGTLSGQVNENAPGDDADYITSVSS